MKKSVSKRTFMEAYFRFVIFTAAVAYLFYDSILSFVALQLLYPFYLKNFLSELVNTKNIEISNQFCEMLGSISTSISAGMSVEKAFDSCEHELIKLYGEKSIICKELHEINKGIRLNVPLSISLKDFAKRTGQDDIDDFVTVFVEATKSGGNLTDIIRSTVTILQDKKRTEDEINAMLKGKMLEQKVISLIPFIIFIFLRITSKEYIEVMYHNSIGIVIMTVCLFIYMLSLIMSKKIVNIQV